MQFGPAFFYWPQNFFEEFGHGKLLEDAYVLNNDTV
jgi:hypothetical protein